MKVVFTINTLVAAILATSIDRKKVEQACEAYRNNMRVLHVTNDETGALESTEKQSRALRIAGSKSKGFAAKERVAYSVTRIGDLNGESNVVARFIAYNDEITLLQTRAAKVEAKVELVQIPLEFSLWLSKFDAKRETAPAAPKSGAKNGNGKPAEANRLAPVTA